MNETNIWLGLGLVIIGMMAHFVKKLADLEQTGTILSPITFIAQRPYATLSAVLGGLILALVAYYAGELSKLAAILIGVGCSDAFDSLRARAVNKMKEAP